MITPAQVRAAVDDFNWDPLTSLGGTSLVGYYEPPHGWTFEETVARLKALSGQDPTARTDGYKVSVEFVGTYKGVTFTLYDYKGDRTLHFGGRDNLRKDGGKMVNIAAALDAALLTVEPAPYEAVEQYEAKGQRHGWPGVDAAVNAPEAQARALEALAETPYVGMTAATIEALQAGAAALRAQATK